MKILFLIFLLLLSISLFSCKSTKEVGWVEMGKGSASHGGISKNSKNSLNSFSPFLCLGSDGNPIIAWGLGTSRIYVRRWHGNSWVEMGAGSASGYGINKVYGNSSLIFLGLANNQELIISWISEIEDNKYKISYKKWDGSSWVEMGEGAPSEDVFRNNLGYNSSPSMIFGSDGNPIITWSYWSGNYDEHSKIYVLRWDGAAWVEMGAGSASEGGISNNIGSSGVPSIILGSDGNPIVAWSDDSGGDYIEEWKIKESEIYVKKWDGTTWVEMGEDSASKGGISNNLRNSYVPKLAIGSDGNPIIAWEDIGIYVRRWNGTAWVEMGAGSASGGGISNSQGSSRDPRIILGSDGNPIVAWSDDLSGISEIYVRRWDGTAWVEIGEGSATGRGISTNPGGSWQTSIICGSDGNPIVAWSGIWSQEEFREIYVLRWEQ